jgi:hypothetical protein
MAKGIAERFWKKVEIGTREECWPWKASKKVNGYGRFGLHGRDNLAHRVAYELAVGPIPQGLTIDHICHNHDHACAGGLSCPHRACVNPAHLEAVTQLQNVRRGRRTGQTHCIHGHPYDKANTIHRPQGGWRQCRMCREIGNRAKSQARKLAALQSKGEISSNSRSYRPPSSAS